jgi:hypothetical protein
MFYRFTSLRGRLGQIAKTISFLSGDAPLKRDEGKEEIPIAAALPASSRQCCTLRSRSLTYA